jgi:uncharacterized alpha-E superfamily protein
VDAFVLERPPEARDEALEWLLEAANSIVTYRARYRRGPELLPVLHLIVLDESNPHAVLFQVRELSLMLERVAVELGDDVAGLDFRDDLGPIADALRDVPLTAFEPEEGETLERACVDLARLLRRAEKLAYGFSDELQRRFFTHVGTHAPVGIGPR